MTAVYVIGGILGYIFMALVSHRVFATRAILDVQRCSKKNEYRCIDHRHGVDAHRFEAWDDDYQALSVLGTIFWPPVLVVSILIWLVFPHGHKGIKTSYDKAKARQLKAEEAERKAKAELKEAQRIERENHERMLRMVLDTRTLALEAGLPTMGLDEILGVASPCDAPALEGRCVLPSGHNMGNVDIPQNHKGPKVKAKVKTQER